LHGHIAGAYTATHDVIAIRREFEFTRFTITPAFAWGKRCITWAKIKHTILMYK
jgi:hypothetical protein